MDIALVLVKADGTTREVRVEAGTLIGREDTCKVRIQSGTVSRKHCRIDLNDDDEVQVTDLGSSNGTFVNGKRVKDAELSPGDVLGVGGFAFVVRIGGFPKDIDSARALAVASGSAGPAAGSMPDAAGAPAPHAKKKPDDDDDEEDDGFADLLRDLNLEDDEDDDGPPRAGPGG